MPLIQVENDRELVVLYSNNDKGQDIMIRLRPLKQSDFKYILEWMQDERSFAIDYVKQSIHFGFVIVDPKYRGKGYGKEMMQQAVRYATDILKVKKVTLGVFDNNPMAHNCYHNIGFVDVNYKKEEFPYKDEQWGLYQMEYEFKLIQ